MDPPSTPSAPCRLAAAKPLAAARSRMPRNPNAMRVLPRDPLHPERSHLCKHRSSHTPRDQSKGPPSHWWSAHPPACRPPAAGWWSQTVGHTCSMSTCLQRCVTLLAQEAPPSLQAQQTCPKGTLLHTASHRWPCPGHQQDQMHHHCSTACAIVTWPPDDTSPSVA